MELIFFSTIVIMLLYVIYIIEINNLLKRKHNRELKKLEIISQFQKNKNNDLINKVKVLNYFQSSYNKKIKYLSEELISLQKIFINKIFHKE